MEYLWLMVVAGGPAIILIVVVLVLLRRRRYQRDVRSPDYEVSGNKYVRDPADRTR